MSFRVYERRERRGMLNQGLGFGTLGYTIANYNTEAVSDKKLDFNFDDEIFNKINCIPNPLRKNLADTVINNEKATKEPEKMRPDPSDFFFPQEFHQEPPKNHQNRTDNIYSSLQGISSFFSNFFGAITGTVFQRRAKSPVTEYFDCFDHNTGYNSEMAPPMHWQESKIHDQNKNLASEHISCELNDNMSSYRATVAQCEQKLTAVKSLLPNKHVVPPNKLRQRPKKVFVEPGAIQQSSEDNFATDSYVSLPDGDYIEYISVINNHIDDTAAIDGPKIKIEPEIKSGSDLHKTKIFTTSPESQIEELDTNTNKIESKTTPLNPKAKKLPNSKSNLNMPEAQITTNSDVNVLDDVETSPIIIEELLNKPIIEITNETEEKSTILNEKAQNLIENSIVKEKPPILCQIPNESTLIPDNKIAQSVITPNQNDVPSKPNELDNQPSKPNELDNQPSKPNELDNQPSKPNELDNQPSKEEIISSVEDKMAKLKLMLQEKRKKTSLHSNSTDSLQNSVESIDKANTKRTQESMKLPVNNIHDKKFKNPHRLSDKRRNSKLKADIQEDMKFAHEIDSSDISSLENSPKVRNSLQIPHPKRLFRKNRLSSTKSDSSSDISKSPATEYFDELKGRFHLSSTTESEDSFQIVFTDSPQRNQRPSDCESEDSFIIFDDSPDSCYTSNDVFGDRETESESNYSDSDTDLSDSGCGIEKLKLSQHLSRTVSDLTDDSLYNDARSNDEIDCAVRTFDEIPNKDIRDVHINNNRNSHKIKAEDKLSLETDLKSVIKNKAKLYSQNQITINKIGDQSDNQKNLVSKDSVNSVQGSENQSRKKPEKKVQFSTAPPKVHVMRVWAYAARQARAGHWERHALDRERFKRRIADVEMAISWVLKPQHRSRVMFQRFMPWRNQLKRLEIAEKKRLKAEEEKRKKEEEEQRIREEVENKIQEEYEEEQRRIQEEERILQEELEKQAKKDTEQEEKQKTQDETKEYAIAIDLVARECESEMETSTSYSSDSCRKETTIYPNFTREKLAGEKRQMAEKMATQKEKTSKREYSKRKSFAKYGVVCMVAILALFHIPTQFGK